MSSSLDKLKNLLGEDRLRGLICLPEVEDSKTDSNQKTVENPAYFTNSNEIFCECRTLILRPNHAKLIVPSDAMLDIERNLKFLQHSDKSFKNLVRGCYWLVDDMYKFEQIGYTKELSATLLQGGDPAKATGQATEQSQSLDNPSTKVLDSADGESTRCLNIRNGLRYLACAECNLCPLGWFDPTTKESYLYVW